MYRKFRERRGSEFRERTGVKESELAKYQERLLEDLSRVERVEVQLGNEEKTW